MSIAIEKIIWNADVKRQANYKNIVLIARMLQTKNNIRVKGRALHNISVKYMIKKYLHLVVKHS